MKVAFAVFLVLHFLTETMAAVSLIGGPQGVMAAGTGNQWSMHYGFAALALASASLWLWRSRHVLAAVTPVLGVLMIFHCGVLTSLILAGDQQVGVVLHSILAVFAIVLFIQRGRWCAV